MQLDWQLECMYTQTQSVPEPHTEVQTNTAEDIFCASLFTHSSRCKGRTARLSCGRHWGVKESSYRIYDCWQCLQNRIMSHSAPIHYIWDLNDEVAGGTRDLKESQKTDERRPEECCEDIWKFWAFSQTGWNKVTHPFFRLYLSLSCSQAGTCGDTIPTAKILNKSCLMG